MNLYRLVITREDLLEILSMPWQSYEYYLLRYFAHRVL